MESRKTSSLVNESEIYGRHEEKEKIVEILLNDLSDDHDGLAVHAICGMGGLGKTTLAQLVYNDGRVLRHFELRIWVCVSDDFDILRLTRAILESIEGGICNVENLDPLQRRLQEKLSGKRFLLVLDDVWNEYHEKWDGLKEALRCGAKGSMVIVTTRIQNVALIMATHPTHHIGYLSKDDSWSLFKQRAFGVGRREGSLQFETLGKAIVEKCGGVPLAIKALGSLMRFKSTETEWLSVKDSEIWDLSDNGSAILPALRLSYDNLPPHLRQCFAFCCIFPKDYEMEKDLLIQLWMANGFIPSRGHMELHDLGHEIFNDLVWRSFLQDGKENFWGDVTCKMHDLMHDLAQSIMRHECCFIVDPSKALKLSVKIRHLYFNKEISFVMVPWKVDLCKVQSLRSLVLVLGERDSWDTFSAIVSKQNCLRVLSCRIMEQLPMSMSHLKHLRYLDFSYSSIKTLPESITCLQNLQTLKLKQCSLLRELPRGMEYMRNLRYLDIRGCDSLICTPPRLGKLTCLQTLSIFIVGQESGHSVGELKRLNLGGELSIKELDNVKNLVAASSANLKRKQNLVSLNLFWRYSEEGNNIPDDVEEVLDGLKPHPNLKKLGITFYGGSKFPDWLMGLALQNLVEVSLAGCDRIENLPPLGKLPFLEVLSLSGMNSVKYFNNECFGDGWNSFPTLKSLKIWGMRNLEEWKTAGRGRGFSCLLDLEIAWCPKLMELPWLPTVKRLSLFCSDMLLKSVTNLTSLTSLNLFHFEGPSIPSGAMLQNLKALESLNIVYPNLKTLSNELDNLTSLKRLSFQICHNLESLPEGIKNFSSLDSLYLSNCDSLTSLPVNGLRGLSSLRRLWIQHCKKLESLSEGVQYLTALQDLLINRCPEMKSLPDYMQHLTALQKLSILYCDGLYSVPSWLGSLPSLTHLEISSCQSLTSLPNGLQGSTLKVLRIGGCPVLEKRCKKERGTDWPKIAHIPTIYISNQRIQSLNC